MAAGPAPLSMLGAMIHCMRFVCETFFILLFFSDTDTYLISWFFLEFPRGFLP